MGQERAKPFRTELIWRTGSHWPESVLSFNGTFFESSHFPGHWAPLGTAMAQKSHRVSSSPRQPESPGHCRPALVDQVLWEQGYSWGVSEVLWALRSLLKVSCFSLACSPVPKEEGEGIRA